MPRLFSLLMLLCLTFNAHADSYISRTLNKPVPGGVAVVDLGPAAAAPKATYQGKPVLVVKEQDNWLAIVGIPLSVKPGNERISSGGRSLPFIVGYKQIPGTAHHPEKQKPGQPRPGSTEAHRGRTGRTDQGLPQLQPQPAE